MQFSSLFFETILVPSFLPFFPFVISVSCLNPTRIFFCIVLVLQINDFASASTASPPVSRHYLLQAATNLQFWKASSL